MLIIRCNQLATHRQVVFILTPPTVIWGLIEYARLHNPRVNDVVIKVLGPMMRRDEQRKLTGTFYFLIGCIVCLWWFPEDVAALALIFLSWCDPAASLVGVTYGHYTWPVGNGKSLAGTLAAILTATVSTWVLYSFVLTDTLPEGMPLWVACVVFGLIAGFAEGVNLLGIDDNLTMPVITSLLILTFFNTWPLLTTP